MWCPQGFRCPKCGRTRYYEICDRKVHQYGQVNFRFSDQRNHIGRHQVPLHSLAFRHPPCYSIKSGVSPHHHLARTIRIAANAALCMKHKLQQTMKDRNGQQPLGSLSLMGDAYGQHNARRQKRPRLFRKNATCCRLLTL
jgi:hypothetical protein